jgi:hypothetical protein
MLFFSHSPSPLPEVDIGTAVRHSTLKKAYTLTSRSPCIGSVPAVAADNANNR